MRKRTGKMLQAGLLYRAGGPGLVLTALKDSLLGTDSLRWKTQDCMLALPFEKIVALRTYHYEQLTGQKLDLLHPQNYGQKMQQILLYDATPIKTRLADKLLVKDYVREVLGEGYTVPTLGVWDSFDRIDFDALPDRFVLKTNHACKTNLLVPDKSSLDRTAAKASFDQWLKLNFGATLLCELHYRGIRPRIFAEQYLESGPQGLADYKVTCILGEPEFVHIVGDRANGGRQSVLDRNGDPLHMEGSTDLPYYADYPVPDNLDEMLQLARRLSRGLDFVRVDFYSVNGHIYVGEMTFTPSALLFGTIQRPENWDFLRPEVQEFIRTGPRTEGRTEESQ